MAQLEIVRERERCFRRRSGRIQSQDCFAHGKAVVTRWRCWLVSSAVQLARRVVILHDERADAVCRKTNRNNNVCRLDVCRRGNA